MKKLNLFSPTDRVGNKALAVQIAQHYLNATPVDKATVTHPTLGDVHVKGFTHAKGAIIRQANNPVEFGGEPWHRLGHIIMVREIAASSADKARITIYICEIEPLFNHVLIGKAGVPWKHVANIAHHTEVHYSNDVAAALENDR